MEILAVDGNRRLWQVYHETYSLCFLPPNINDSRSRSEVRYRTRDLTLTSGRTFMVEPGELHVTKRMFGPPASFRVLNLSPSLVAELAEDLGHAGHLHLRVSLSDAPMLLACLEGFYHAFCQREAALELHSRLLATLHQVFETAGERRPPVVRDAFHPALRRARDYLHSHFVEPVRLDDLASVTGLSRYHLLRCFHRTFGLPPHAYQVRLRVSAVQEALRRYGELPQGLAGFYDQSHLCRHFKRVMGISPGKYLNAVGGARKANYGAGSIQ